MQNENALHPEDPPLEARRGQIPIDYGKQAQISDKVYKRLKTVDEGLEFIFYVPAQDWHVYHVTLYGIVPAEDLLTHQMCLERDVPSDWAVNKVQCAVGTNTEYGTLSPERVKRHMVERMRLAIADYELQKQKNIEDIMEETRYFMNTWAVKRRRGLVFSGDRDNVALAG